MDPPSGDPAGSTQDDDQEMQLWETECEGWIHISKDTETEF